MRQWLAPQPLRAPRVAGVYVPRSPTAGVLHGVVSAHEPRLVAGGVHGRVKVEAGVVRVERHVALHPRRVRVGAHPQRPPPGPGAEGRPAQHRGLRQAGQCDRLVRQGIDGLGAAGRVQRP